MTALVKLQHAKLGRCEIVRVEATDWIVRVAATGLLFRIPPDKRGQFQVTVVPPSVMVPPSHSVDETPTVTGPPSRIQSPPLNEQDAVPLDQPLLVQLPPPRIQAPLATQPPLLTNPSSTNHMESRAARRTIESLRIGLPSLNGTTHKLAVGFQEIEKTLSSFLRDIEVDGGGAMILKGAYGQGKTFAMSILEDISSETGFLSARTEIDATENKLNMPHHIYRDLMRNLRLPGNRETGVGPFAARVQELLDRNCPRDYRPRRAWLSEQLGCEPLAWLLSDPELISKPILLGLLEGDTNVPIGRARDSHVFSPPPRYWPAFTAGTQGDFASYLLSGIGRLARLLGFKGLVILMDEMEKWYELNWTEQARAGNLLGGLIWGATAEVGQRAKHDNPRNLSHSHRGGGYPFSTEQRSHVGVAIAMTPRGNQDADLTWSCYGPIFPANVPVLNERRVVEYCRLIAPFFASAYGLVLPNEIEVGTIATNATRVWKSYGDRTNRSGVQSVIAAFDTWRDSNRVF